MKKIHVLTVLTIALTGALIVGAWNVQAHGYETESSLVQKLAQKFGLNENDVQGVFDEIRTERQTQMQAKFEERVTEQVQEGKLTEEQKKAILAKHEELSAKSNANRETWQNMTREERHTAMLEKKQEMETWAEQNGIDLSLLWGFGHAPHMMGRGQMHMW